MLLLGHRFQPSYAQSRSWTLDEMVAYIGADEWHDNGIWGTGVRVGVLDLGFQNADQITERIHFPDDVNAANIINGNQVHGTEILEIMHAIAPEADYYLYPVSPAGDNVRQAVDWLIEQQVQVVAFAASTLDLPLNGDNVSARQMDRLADSGAIVVVSAGNHGRSILSDTFQDTNGDGWHEYTGGYSGWGVTPLQSSRFGQAHLRWDDVWGSASIDLDLYILGADARTVIAASTDIQNGNNGMLPFEDTFFNMIAGRQYYVAIRAKDPSQSISARFYLFVDDAVLSTASMESSIMAPGDSLQAITVGGLERDGTIYDRSGRGPTWDGRLKPELVAPSRLILSERGLTYEFEGTSAATPVVAGVVVLLRQMMPDATAEDIKTYLYTNARDIVAIGPDNYSGYGIVSILFPETE
jgi:subtilisin family serine protease